MPISDLTKAAVLSAAMTLSACVAPVSGDPDIVGVAQTAGGFDTLVTAVAAADLVETLQGPGPFTVFAPTNEAFAALPTGTLDTLLKPENKAQLTEILTYHVVAGEITVADLVGRQTMLTTVNGETLRVDGSDGVKVGHATVISADVPASNGVIHVIDTVLLP